MLRVCPSKVLLYLEQQKGVVSVGKGQRLQAVLHCVSCRPSLPNLTRLIAAGWGPDGHGHRGRVHLRGDLQGRAGHAADAQRARRAVHGQLGAPHQRLTGASRVLPTALLGTPPMKDALAELGGRSCAMLLGDRYGLR